MQEDFLHYIWKLKKFETLHLKTTLGEQITLFKVGEHNHNSGPDFFNAQLKINNQLWAGNVEIHLKSSDWYLHNHETDKAYDNVILHVVWQDDAEIFRNDNSVIPTLELQNYVDKNLLDNYKKLFSKKQKWINCENDFATVNDFTFNNWIERLYLERLERKAEEINTLLNTSKNNWEAVLFKMLAKNFGLKVNGEAFLSLANSIDFSVIRKVLVKQNQLEALLLGQSGLLNDEVETYYHKTLKNEFDFLKQKFNLKSQSVLPIQFFRLRPPNFPTIRLSQLASLYNEQQNLFSKVIEIQNKNDFYKLFKIEASEFWKTHYTFSKTSKISKKELSKSFIDLLLINTIIPLKFAYSRQQGKESNAVILNLIKEIKIESNSIVSKFTDLKPIEKTVMQSQALLQLKKEYCDKNKCLQCAIGNTLLSQ